MRDFSICILPKYSFFRFFLFLPSGSHSSKRQRLQLFYSWYTVFLHFPFSILFSCAPVTADASEFIFYLTLDVWKNHSLYFRPMDVYRNCLKPSEPQRLNLFFSSVKKNVCNILYCWRGYLLHRKPLLPKTLEKKTVCNLPPLFLCLSCGCLLLSVG